MTVLPEPVINADENAYTSYKLDAFSLYIIVKYERKNMAVMFEIAEEI